MAFFRRSRPVEAPAPATSAVEHDDPEAGDDFEVPGDEAGEPEEVDGIDDAEAEWTRRAQAVIPGGACALAAVAVVAAAPVGARSNGRRATAAAVQDVGVAVPESGADIPGVFLAVHFAAARSR